MAAQNPAGMQTSSVLAQSQAQAQPLYPGQQEMKATADISQIRVTHQSLDSSQTPVNIGSPQVLEQCPP